LSFGSRARLACALLLVLSLPGGAGAQTEVWLGVTKGRTVRIPIGVRGIGGEESLGLVAAQTLERDLALAGFFDLIPWVSDDTLRARAVVSGSVDAASGVLEGVLDQAPGGRRIVSGKYPFSGGGPRQAAHRFADEIIHHLTGERGVCRTRIAFVRSDGTNSDLYTVDWDGANAKRLLGNGSLNLTPRWAPDGKRLLYTSYVHGNPGIYWLDALGEGGGPVVQSQGLASAPAWSPDGKRIAFMMSREGNSEIYVMNRDGSGLTRLTYHDGIDTSPTWAPNGRQIAFTSDRSGRPQIYRMNDDGSDVVRLTFVGGYNASPRWSPLGDRILYVSREEGGFQVRVLDLTDQESYLLTLGSGSNEDPEWSPDGRYIVFSSSRTGKRKLYVMLADGSGVRPLLPGDGNDYSPSWSPRPED
jgi:TolB protein